MWRILSKLDYFGPQVENELPTQYENIGLHLSLYNSYIF